MSKIKSLSYGLELEMVEAASNLPVLVESQGFGLRRDASIQDNNGRQLRAESLQAVEVVTPIYTKSIAWRSNTPIADIGAHELLHLTHCAAKVNSSCGVHIHVGNPVDTGESTVWNPMRERHHNSPVPKSHWTPAQVQTWLAAGLLFEQTWLYSTVPRSRFNSDTCSAITDRYSPSELQSNDPIGKLVYRKYNNDKRYCWLNVTETKRQKDPNENRIGYASSEPFGTVEIRLLGETKDLEYITNWVNLWLYTAAIIASFPFNKAMLIFLHDRTLMAKVHQLACQANAHEQTIATQVRSIVTPRHPIQQEVE